MDFWVAQNVENEEFLSGSVFDSTFRVPSDDDLDQWRIAAGLLNVDNSLFVEQDTYFNWRY